MSDNEKKLKLMSPEMEAVAAAVMALRGEYDPDAHPDTHTSTSQRDDAKANLRNAIYAATGELVAAGFNVFNTGPALLAIENCKSYAGALVVHYELDKLRRMLGLEKPTQLTRGPGGGR